MAISPITLWQTDGEIMETVTIYFLGLPNHCIWWLQPWNYKMLASWKKSFEKPRQHIKKQRHHFVDRCSYHQSSGFSSSQLWMWELDHKEGWALKNWCFPTVVLEKTLKSPLDCKEIKPANPKGNQPLIFIGRIEAKAESSSTSATICKEQTLWKRPWCWKRLRAGEGGNRGWDSWTASSTQWTWVWTNSVR